MLLRQAAIIVLVIYIIALCGRLYPGNVETTIREALILYDRVREKVDALDDVDPVVKAELKKIIDAIPDELKKGGNK